MKFTVNTSEINKALSVVSRAIASKAAQPILECVYLKTDLKSNMLYLKGMDADLSIVTRIPAVIQIEGEIVVAMRKLVDIIRTYPEGSVEFTVDDKNVVRISCLKAAVNSDVMLLGRNASEYPEIASYDVGSVQITSSVMKNLIRNTVFACASLDSAAPILSGVNVQIEAGDIKFSALDGFMLAIRKEKIPNTDINLSCVVPGRTMSDLLKILSVYDYDVFVSIQNKKFIIDIGGDTQICSNILNGEYINCEALIPKEINTVIKLDTDELKSSVERCSLISDDVNSSLVKMEFDEESVKVSSRSEIGQVVESVSSNKSGSSISIAFNSKYILEILKNITDDRIVLEMKDNHSAALIKPVDNDSYLYLVMPVRYVD